MIAVQETIQLNNARDIYLAAFKRRYGKDHLGLLNQEVQALGMVVNRIKNQKKILNVINHYFTMDGLSPDVPFFKNQTHPCRMLLKYLDQVWGSYCSSLGGGGVDTFVVGYTIEGWPVMGRKPLDG